MRRESQKKLQMYRQKDVETIDTEALQTNWIEQVSEGQYYDGY